MVLLHCGSVWRRAQKRDSGHCLKFCPGGSCPPALALMLDTLVPPYMPLVPFKVLPQCWSPEEVSLSKSFCRTLQEEMPENPAVSSTDPTPTVFSAKVYGDFIFLTLEPWAMWFGVGLGPFAPEISLCFI